MAVTACTIGGRERGATERLAAREADLPETAGASGGADWHRVAALSTRRSREALHSRGRADGSTRGVRWQDDGFSGSCGGRRRRVHGQLGGPTRYAQCRQGARLAAPPDLLPEKVHRVPRPGWWRWPTVGAVPAAAELRFRGDGLSDGLTAEQRPVRLTSLGGHVRRRPPPRRLPPRLMAGHLPARRAAAPWMPSTSTTADGTFTDHAAACRVAVTPPRTGGGGGRLRR